MTSTIFYLDIFARFKAFPRSGNIDQAKILELLANTRKSRLMTRKVIHTEKAPAPVGPYNQAVAASGQMLFVSGQISIDPATNKIVYPDDVVKQTERVMANIQAILEAGGATFDNVVKMNVFLADMNDFAIVNEIYAAYFDPENAPARAAVEVSRLPKDVAIEIECIAVL